MRQQFIRGLAARALAMHGGLAIQSRVELVRFHVALEFRGAIKGALACLADCTLGSCSGVFVVGGMVVMAVWLDWSKEVSAAGDVSWDAVFG